MRPVPALMAPESDEGAIINSPVWLNRFTRPMRIVPAPDVAGGPPPLESGVVGVVVTFRPSASFDDALTSFVNQLSTTVLVSNDEDPATIERLHQLIDPLRSHDVSGRKGTVLPIFNRRNRGLSAAFNQALGALAGSDFEGLLLLDQDTHLRPGAVAALVKEWKELSRRVQVGAIGCHNLEQVQVSGFPLGALDRVRGMYVSHRSTPSAAGTSPTEQPVFQNSGTMLPFQALQGAGTFDERMFVDAVDYDYSFRLRKLGYRIFRSAEAQADHSVGTPFTTRVLGRELRLRTYSTQRSYYIVRDTTRLLRKWWMSFPIEVLGIATRAGIGVLGSLLFLPDRYDRGSAILRALGDADSR